MQICLTGSAAVCFLPNAPIERLQYKPHVWLSLGLTAVLVVLAFYSWQGMHTGKGPRGSRPLPLLSVFALDDRTEIDIRKGVFSPIGRLEVRDAGLDPDAAVGNVPICSGALVWKDLVLTNAHCVLPHGGDKTVWFRPGYQRGYTVPAARMIERWVGTPQPNRYRGQDWALLRLDAMLGEQVGWLEVADPDQVPGIGPEALAFVSYASDFHSGSMPAFQSNCRITALNIVKFLLRHDCDMNSGASGAPLLRRLESGTLQIVGINAAHTGKKAFNYFPTFVPQKANFAVHPTAFLALLRQLVATTDPASH